MVTRGNTATSDILRRLALPGALPFLLLLSFYTGCAPILPHRNNPKACELAGACRDAMVERAGGYTLGYVEYNNAGEYAAPAQLDTVVQQIQAQAGNGLILVGFLHGWKADAQQEQWVQAFRAMLQSIAARENAEAAAAGRAPRHVAGVFLGWPGRSGMLEPFNVMAYFRRKDASERVAMGALGDTLLRLKQLRNSEPARPSNDRPAQPAGNRLVLLGHSLGAAMLYQRLVEEPLRNPGQVREPLADLVVLLSAAIPAADAGALERLSPADRTVLPPLLFITSENDRTLRFGFPIGQWLENPRRAAEAGRDAYLQAMGVQTSLTTHRLELDGEDCTAAGCVGVLRLRETGSGNTGLPVYQISAATSVMAGHKDIGNPQLVRFIAGLVGLPPGSGLNRAALAKVFSPAETATP